MLKVMANSLDSIADYRLSEDEIPAPGPGEILVKIGSCGVGYVDALVALGRYQVKPELPHTPGQEVAGTIAAVGGDVSRFAPGDRVMATVGGGFAEYGLARNDAVEKIPDSLSFGQAAGFRVNYVTALHGLRDRAAIRPNERLLVLGAAGGVGLAAVQVGRCLEAEVIAVASTPEKRKFALDNGAHRAIDSSADGWRDRLKEACGGSGPDVVFDPVCGDLFEPAFRSLTWRGRHLVVGFVGGPIPALRANLPLMKGAALVGVDYRQFLLFEKKRAAEHLEQLLAWVEQGRLVPPVGKRYPIDQFAEALEFALSGKGLGKTVVAVGIQEGNTAT